MRVWISLVVFLAACTCWADIFNDLDEMLHVSDRPLEVQSALRTLDTAQIPADGALRATVVEYRMMQVPSKRELEDLRGMVTIRLVQRGERSVDVGAVRARAQAIKKGIEYTEPAKQQQSNWLEKGLKDFFDWVGNIIRNLFNWNPPRSRLSGVPGFPNLSGLFTVIQILLYGAILIGLGWLLTYMVRHWGIHRTRKAKGLMDEEEEQLSLDEWLSRAGALARKGDHRGACRCLYLAILVRLDDATVMSLIRTETNWEHQRRFDASNKQPKDWLLRPATQAFDLIWYGNHCRGEEDTQWFQERYDSLLMALGRKAA